MTSTAQEMDQDERELLGDDSGQAAVLQSAAEAAAKDPSLLGETAPPTTVINNTINTGLGGESGWVLKVVPEHKCIVPTIDNQTFVGSIWKCGECSQNYLVYEKRGKDAGAKALKRIDQEKAAELRAKAAARGNESDPEE